jgi:hypothetical protein
MTMEREPTEASSLPGTPMVTPPAENVEARSVNEGALDQTTKHAPGIVDAADEHASSQADAAADNDREAIASNKRATRSRKSKGRSSITSTSELPTPGRAKSVRSSTTKVVSADQVPNGAKEVSAPIVDTPKRSRRKVVKDTVEKAANPAPSSSPAPMRDMPPITSEAITFLNNPDAKAADLFKLAPASQAFVQYHITNMQRLEAVSSLAHAQLLATATKYSVRYEQAVDALASKLVHDRPTLYAVRDTATETNLAAGHAVDTSGVSYGPRQPAVSISLRKMIYPNPVDTPAEPAEENSIEADLTADRARDPEKNQPIYPSADESIPSNSAVGQTSQRLLGRMWTALQMSTAWLQNKEQKAPASTEADRSKDENKSTGGMSDKILIVPDNVARRFLKVDSEYYFPDKTPAFSDRGIKLATRGDHPEVIRSLVDIAFARDWKSITVKGSESFRHAAWLEAAGKGLKVAGYQPTPLDLADLASRPVGNSIEKEMTNERSNVSRPSGENVAVSRINADSDNRPTANHGVMPGNPELIAKASSFDKDKPSLVIKKHPDLAPAYGVVDAAKKFAESKLPPEAREEFVGLARRHVLNKILSGDAVIGPKVYTTQVKTGDQADRSNETNTTSLNLEKAPRAKETARQR